LTGACARTRSVEYNDLSFRFLYKGVNRKPQRGEQGLALNNANVLSFMLPPRKFAAELFEVYAVSKSCRNGHILDARAGYAVISVTGRHR
jgi:hypothetical protein